jgi:hypothetical protein
MPDEFGIHSDEELDALAASWDLAPSIRDFPQSEIDRIKADPNTVGWIESPYGAGEVYLGRDRKFFSPTQPQTAHIWNTILADPPMAWCQAFGPPIGYILGCGSRWGKVPYYVKPEVLEAATNSYDPNVMY